METDLSTYLNCYAGKFVGLINSYNMHVNYIQLKKLFLNSFFLTKYIISIYFHTTSHSTQHLISFTLYLMGSIQTLCFHCNGYITTEIYYQSSQIYVLVWSELNQCYLPSNSNIFQHLFNSSQHQ